MIFKNIKNYFFLGSLIFTSLFLVGKEFSKVGVASVGENQFFNVLILEVLRLIYRYCHVPD